MLEMTDVSALNTSNCNTLTNELHSHSINEPYILKEIDGFKNVVPLP